MSVRALIADYLNDTISLRDFQVGFVPFLLNAKPTDDQSTTAIVYGTELCLAELTNGDLTVDDLRSDLAQLLDSPYAVRKTAVNTANNTTTSFSFFPGR